MSRIDPSLLEPVDDRDEDRVTPKTLLVLVAVVVLMVSAAVLAAWFLLGRGSGSDGAAATTLSPEEVAASKILVDLEPEDPMVFWPTVAPADWELCRESPNPRSGARWCSPDGGEWVQMAVLPEARLEGRPPGPLPRSTLIDDGASRLVLSIPIGIQDSSVVLNVTSQGITRNDLAVITASVPVIGETAIFAPVDEPDFDVTAFNEDQLATLIRGDVDTPKVVVDRRSFNVFGQSATLLASVSHVGAAPPSHLLDRFWWIESPRLIEADRAVIVGTDQGQAVAIWDQGDWNWILTGPTTTDRIADRAVSVIEAVKELTSQR